MSDNQLSDIQHKRDVWFRLGMFFSGIGWTLSILIASLSAFVASGLSDEKPRQYAALAVAIAASLQAVLQPQRRARLYRESWINLDLAIKQLQGVPPSIIDALRVGEKYIGEALTEKHETPPTSKPETPPSSH
jgi:hypothetical protein